MTRRDIIACKIQTGDVYVSGLRNGELHEIEWRVFDQFSEGIAIIVAAEVKGVSVKFVNRQNIISHIHENLYEGGLLYLGIRIQKQINKTLKISSLFFKIVPIKIFTFSRAIEPVVEVFFYSS